MSAYLMDGPTLQVCKEILPRVGVGGEGEGGGQNLQQEHQRAQGQQERDEAEQSQRLDHLLHPGVSRDQHEAGGDSACAVLLPLLVSPSPGDVEAAILSPPRRDGRNLCRVQLVVREVHCGLGHIRPRV